MKNFLKDVKITQVASVTSAATSAVNTASVDMAGFESVVFLTSIGTANAGNTVHAAGSADDSTFVDLAGTSVSPGDNLDSAAIDVVKPFKRYVRAEITRGVSTTIGDVYAFQYGGVRKAPVTQGTKIDNETHISPSTGTA